MSAITDARRFLLLHSVGCVTLDEPIELLERVLEHVEKTGNDTRLIARNLQLTTQNTELQTKVREANERTRLVEHYAVQLEEKVKRLQAAQSQTQPVVLPRQMRLPEPKTIVVQPQRDFLDEIDFIPCRDERCGRESLHPLHTNGLTKRGPRKTKHA
jgi:phage anti-repressor protein